jgi:hypothetical protein
MVGGFGAVRELLAVLRTLIVIVAYAWDQKANLLIRGN